MAWRVLREEKDVFVVETDRGEVKVAKSGLSKGKVEKWQAMCRGGEVKPRKMAQGGEVKPSPDELRKTKAPPNALKKAGEFLGERTREFTEGLVGVPGTAWGEGMNAAMAAGRSVLPGGQSYADELEKVRLAREERYPGAYSVIDEVRLPARRAALADDSASQAMGIAAPIAVHASPVRWAGQPTRAKAGTGEGGAAYGEGLYASIPANAKGIDGRYREAHLAEQRPVVRLDGFDLDTMSLNPILKTALLREFPAKLKRGQAIDADGALTMARIKLQDAAEFWERGARNPADADLRGEYLNTASDYRDALAELSKLKPEQFSVPEAGSFHVWDVPDKMLDWDAPLGQQPVGRELLESDFPLVGKDAYGWKGAPEGAAERALNTPSRTGKWLHSELGRDRAGNLLKERGIVGHRYLGEAGSSGEAKGIPNFVIYDDAAVKPLGTFASADEFLASDLYKELRPRIEAEQAAMAQRYPHLAEYLKKAPESAPTRFAKGGEVQPYTLLDEDDATFTVDDGAGAFKIAKADLSPALQGKIRGFAKGGLVKPEPTSVDDFTAALAAYEASRGAPPVDPGAPPPQIEDPRAYAPPPPTGPVVDVRTGRVVTIPAPPEPTPEQTGPILPAGGIYPPGSDPGLALPASHAPAPTVDSLALAAHTPSFPAPALLASHAPVSTPTTLADGALPGSAPPVSSSLPGAPRGVQGEIAAGRAQQATGLQAQADAAAREAEEQARILAETEQRRAAAQKDYEARLKDLQSQGDALYQNILDKKVDPRRLWNDASLGRQVTASIGMILGGIGSALTKGPNYAVEIIDRAIQRDIDAQKTEIDKGQNLLAHNLRQTDDLRLAHQLTRADLLDSSAAQIQRAAASFAGEKAQAQATAAIGSLRAEAAKERQAVAATAMQMAAQAELLPLQVDAAKRGAAMQRLQMEALGALLNGGGADPRMMAYLPDEIRERVVVAPGGKAYAMPTKEEAAKVRDQVQGYKEVTAAVGDMRKLRGEGGRAWLPLTEESAVGESMRRKMIGGMRLAVVGPGAMNESELQILSDLVPAPGEIFRSDAAFEGKMRMLEQIAYDAMWSSLTGRGGFDIKRYKAGGAKDGAR